MAGATIVPADCSSTRSLMLEQTEVQCPYCGEVIATEVDGSVGRYRYIEDCPVCCRPIEFEAELDLDGAPVLLRARRDDD
jgi:endogenous inhibitor of DNA gyrase (YacG/DUF329 family)